MIKDGSQQEFGFPISIWELKHDSCRYILNEGSATTYIFCGKPKDKSSYCAEHYKICYIPSTSPKFRKR